MNNCTTLEVVHSRRYALLMCGLALYTVAHLASASTPALYGEDYVRRGHSWAEGSPRQLPGPAEQIGDVDSDALVAQLQQRERAAGPYSDALAEPLSSLARYHRSQGSFGEALRLYQRALHVVRVNDGLYSERQIPLVRDLLATYRLLGDIEALDERYEYFFRLYGNGNPPYTELRMRATLEYLRWQREMLRSEPTGNQNNRLLELYSLNERILESAALSTQVTDSWYTQLVLSQVRNLYLLQSATEPADPVNSLQSSAVIPSNGAQDWDFKLQRLQSIVQRSSRTGRDLLQRLIVRGQVSGNKTELAGAQIELGDWLLWNGSRSRAYESYSRALTTLTDAGEHDLLEVWLGAPAELPANGAFWQPDSPGEERRRIMLSAQFDVSVRGKARNIRVSSEQPEDAAFAPKLRKQLSSALYRPRITASGPEGVTGLRRDYELLVD